MLLFSFNKENTLLNSPRKCLEKKTKSICVYVLLLEITKIEFLIGLLKL